MPEEQLIENSKNSDKESFAKLYDLYVRQIYDFIYYKTHHKETAQDLTSETFLKALKNIAHYDVRRSFKSWVYKIAQNTVIDHYRKHKTTADIDDIWDIESDDDVLRDSVTREQVKILQIHLSKLPQIQRDIITLRVWQGLSYKEIAEIVGKSEDNCKVIYSRTLSSLKGLMPALLLILILKL